MLPADTDPITTDWTMHPQGCTEATTLAEVVGRVDPGRLAPWRGELAAAADELARSAGSGLRWTPDDGVVPLLRAIGMLARTAPSACSPAGASLVALLAEAG